MILKLFPYENEINFENEKVNVLEIKNKKLFLNLCKSFYTHSLYNSGVECIKLFENDKLLNMSKNIIVITDIFKIDFNDKSILNKLYDSIEQFLNINVDIKNGIATKYTALTQLFEEVLYDFDFEVQLNFDFNVKKFLKHLSLKVKVNENDEIINNIFLFIDIVSQFNLCSILVFVNLKKFFEDNEILEIYKYSKYKKLNILLLECGNNIKLLHNERKLYIDEEYDDFVYTL